MTGLRRGQLRLGSFFTALVYLSAEAATVLQGRHPDLFTSPARLIQAAIVRGNRSPLARATVEALHEVGTRRGAGP